MGGYFPTPGGPGKDQALQKRFDRLEMIASEKGVLEKGLIPDGLKTAFARTVDILMRPNYAVAGAFDVLSGTGQGSETMGGRVFRELFGEGDKETFGDVLKQAGYGEGGKLSDLIGANWLTNRWDPTARGTVGLALDVFLDPLTYTGFKGGQFFVHGKAGSFRLSPAGKSLLQKRTTKRILRAGSKLGKVAPDDVAEVLAKGKTKAGKTLGQIELESLKAIQEKSIWRRAGVFGQSAVRRKMLVTEGRQMAGEIAAGKLGRGVTDPLALKFGSFPIMKASTLTKPVRDTFSMMGRAIEKMPNGEALVDLLRGIRDHGDAMFNMVPWAARAKPAYAAFEATNFATKNQAEAVALEIVRDQVFGDAVMTKLAKDKDALWSLAKMADDPAKYADEWIRAAQKAGISAEQAADVAKNWKALADDMYWIEREAGLQTHGPIAAYIPHILSDGLSKLKLKRIAELPEMQRALKGSTDFTGESVERFAERRSYITFDKLFKEAKKHGFDNPEELVNKNAIDLMVKRVQAHYGALADKEFIENTLGTYAAGAIKDVNKRIRHTLPEIGHGLAEWSSGLKKKIDVDDVKIREAINAEAELASNIVRGKIPDKDALKAHMKRVKKMKPEEQAAFFQEMVPKIKTLADLTLFNSRYRKTLNGIPKKYTQKMKSLAKSTNNATIKGAPAGYTKAVIEKGAYAGQWVVPDGVADGLHRWKAVWAENPEVRAFVKSVDFLTNWFKLLVTAPFPAFHVRNAYSNVFASAVDIRFAAFNPRLHKRAVDLMFTDKEFTIVSKTGEHLTSAELKGELKGLGLNIDQFLLAERTGSKEALTKSMSDSAFKKAVKASTVGAGRTIENEARILHYVSLRERGLSASEALQRVNEFLFDYNRLSPTEKNLFKRLIPFYTWNNKNVRRQAKNLLERPGEAMAPVKAFDRGPDSDALPEYLHGKLGIKLMNAPGKAGTHITGIDLPISNIDILWKGGLGKTIRNNLSMMNPLLKAPLEYALNMDSFTGRGIRGRQWLGQMGPTMDRHLPQVLKDYFQLQKHENGGYTANGTRVYLAFKAAIWSRFVSTSVKVDEIIQDPRTAEGWFRVLSGINFNEFEMDESETKELRNKIDRLEEYLLDNGYAQEFRVVSPQKAKKKPLFGGLQ